MAGNNGCRAWRDVPSQHSATLVSNWYFTRSLTSLGRAMLSAFKQTSTARGQPVGFKLYPARARFSQGPQPQNSAQSIENKILNEKHSPNRGDNARCSSNVRQQRDNATGHPCSPAQRSLFTGTFSATADGSAERGMAAKLGVKSRVALDIPSAGAVLG